MRVTRRGILIGAAAGGGLVAAFALMPRRYAVPLDAGKGEHAFNAWLRVSRGGVVTVALPVCEMGQGISTILPQIAAVEMGADWRQIAIEPAPQSPVYADPVLAAHWARLWMPAFPSLADAPGDALAERYADRAPLLVTADGTALAAYEQPLREAAAGVRAVLAMAAAEKWGVRWEECQAKDGFILHGDKQARFGELADKAAGFDAPSPLVLLQDAAREVPSSVPEGMRPAFPRIDLPAKVDGSFTFAGDVRVPEMVHAAIMHGPQGNSVLGRYDKDAAASVPGLAGVVHARGWLAAAANTWHAAETAVKAMAPTFRAAGPVADSGTMDDAMDKALKSGKAHRVAGTGNPDAVLAKPDLSVRYDVEPALHAAIETATATARIKDGRLELWLATQAPERARRVAARIAGVSLADTILYPMQAGGSFDARLDTRIAAEATAIARALDKPVQLRWSRWQESLASFPRTPVAAQLSAAVGPDRMQVLGWRTRMALPATAIEAGERLLHGKSPPDALDAASGKTDPTACEAALPPYAIPECAVDHVPVDLALPTGRYRSNAHGYGAFFTECFIDEVAHHGSREPLSFRIGMLGDNPRLVACLQGVAKLSNWGGGGDNSGQGIACHTMRLAGPDGMREGHIAVVATARRDEGGVRVDRLSAFLDIGGIVNMDIARQQVEGGMVFGLGMAIGGSTGYARGLPLAGHLSELALPLLADCPAIDVAFADSGEGPFDPGELAVAPVAPAIANALFSATGLRFRRLPLLSDGL
ncbi:molybdopterin cofactor-binding domain-containing protein [Novosphingobium sp. ZN18A2]|uniref:molybdopterin cofactor-binding domain-containing protein n=1 Tax=Novosphingobium sp. ZN18A2 TaxID=3079861 RepID=UPI0030CD50DC